MQHRILQFAGSGLQSWVYHLTRFFFYLFPIEIETLAYTVWWLHAVYMYMQNRLRFSVPIIMACYLYTCIGTLPKFKYAVKKLCTTYNM